MKPEQAKEVGSRPKLSLLMEHKQELQGRGERTHGHHRPPALNQI